MQLERILIEDLFGRFNYEISLRRPDKITIIHAPNGFGKTVVLTLVNAFFAGRFGIFFKYQFRAVVFYFDNQEGVAIRKGGNPDLFRQNPKQPQEIQIALLSPTQEGQAPYNLNSLEGLPPLDRFMPWLEPAGLDAWYDDNNDDVITTSDATKKYAAHLPPEYATKAKVPDWLEKIINSSECRLIETQRLLKLERTEDPHARYRSRRPTPPKPVVEMEARDLATRIRTTLADYANRAQTLDQSFPRRVINALGSHVAPSAEDVSSRLRTVEQKRTSLIETGLLDKAGVPEILPQAESIGEQESKVIGVYLDDIEQKFSRFDELFLRVSLFKEIINEKFQFKSVQVSREEGISVRTTEGRKIALPDLSSGEQHELVLLYELLFGIKQDALILIDEPALSLHVGWQIRFLPDLQRIQKLNAFQIIIATHSPQIINDRWDLTIELKK